jgi:hypothetical protein
MADYPMSGAEIGLLSAACETVKNGKGREQMRSYSPSCFCATGTLVAAASGRERTWTSLL